MADVEQLNQSGNKRGLSPNSRKNLELGHKPNRRTAKDYSITRIIKEMIDLPADERWLEVDDKGKQLTWRQAIAKRILIEAVRGNVAVNVELLDRLEGKVKTVNELQLLGINFNPEEFYLAYRRGVQQFLDNPKLRDEVVKELPGPESPKNGTKNPDVV